MSYVLVQSLRLTFPWPRGGRITPQTDLFAAISEPLGVNRNALVTFPKYDGATKWHIFHYSNPTRRSKMAAAKPVTNIFLFRNNIHSGMSGSVTPRNEISTATPTFSVSMKSRALLLIQPRVSGSRKLKMATAKPVIYIDIHIRNAHCISQLFQTR